LGRRIRKDLSSFANDIVYFYNEQWQLLEERKGGDADPLSQYVWHPYYIDALAVRYYDFSTAGTQVRQWYLQDANYNVTAVLNDSANVLERYSYTPYGGVAFLNSTLGVIASTAIGNTHLFTGRELDAETGLQLNRWRFYANWLGRWMTRDPIQYIAEKNLYQYVNNRPLLLLDPQGLEPSKQRTNQECCDECENTKSCIRDNANAGVICCDGRKVICVWKLPKMKSPVAGLISSFCAQQHEQTHIDDIDCDPKKCLDRPKFKDDKDPDTEECEGYTFQVDCLKLAKAACFGDQQCEREIDYDIKSRTITRDQMCKNAKKRNK